MGGGVNGTGPSGKVSMFVVRLIVEGLSKQRQAVTFTT